MKLQKTFEGNRADNNAIDWLNDLARCFNIKKATIKEVKQPHNWRGKRVRLEVRFD